MNSIKRALISVWDKDGIVELAEFLINNKVEIISTGGTKKILESNNIAVTPVSAITNQNEIILKKFYFYVHLSQFQIVLEHLHKLELHQNN